MGRGPSAGRARAERLASPVRAMGTRDADAIRTSVTKGAQDPRTVGSLLPMDAAPHRDLLAHARFARGLARALLGDEHLAEDAVQETWLAALRRPPRALSAAWIAEVARNAARKIRRGESRRAARERASAVPEAAEGQWRPERQAALREVVDAVLALEEPYRSTVLLRFYEGVPPREIAARQAVSVSTVNSRLQRALARLRERLDAKDGGRGAWAVALAPLAGAPRGTAAPAPGPGSGTATSYATAGGIAMGATAKVLAASAVVLVGAFAAWRLAADEEPASSSGEAPPAAKAPHSEPAALAPRQRAAPATDASLATGVGTASQKPDAAAAASTAGVVEGTVEVPEGASAAGGLAWVTATVDGAQRVVARRELPADGRFRLEVPRETVGEALGCEVTVRVNGLRSERRGVTLRAGETQRADFRLETGLAISGVVVTPSGDVVPDLPLLVYATEDTSRVVTDEVLDFETRIGRGQNTRWTETRTDAYGRFVARGLWPGGHAIASVAASWALRTDAQVRAGDADVRVIATPAQSVVLRVKSAADGKPVTSSVHLLFRWDSAKGRSTTSRNYTAVEGKITFRWGRGDALPFGRIGSFPSVDERTLADVQVHVKAEGFHARTLTVAGTAGVEILDVELDPVSDASVGRIRLEVVDARGALVDEELRATVFGDGGTRPTTSRLSREAPGRFVLSASPGTWRLELVPAEVSLSDARALHHVEIVAGAVLDLRVALPEMGRITGRRSVDREVKITLSTQGGSLSETLGPESKTWRVLAGTWTVTVGEGAGAKVREVEVRAFEETVVDVDE